MNKVGRIIFIVVYMFISTWLFSFWLLNDKGGSAKPSLINISIFILLVTINLVFLIIYYKKNLKDLFIVIFSLMIVLSSLSIVREVMIEVRYLSPVHRSIEAVFDRVEGHFIKTRDFDLKGTVEGERIGKSLINGPNLDEEGKHYLELDKMVEEITIENKEFGGYEHSFGVFNPYMENRTKYIEYVIIDNRINDYFIKYRSDDISKSEDNDYKFFIVVDSSSSIEKTEDRIEFVMSTGEVPRLAPDGETLEGEIIVFKK